MFPVQTTPDEFKNAKIVGHFGFVIEETSVREINKVPFQNVYRPHENEDSVLKFSEFKQRLQTGPFS